MPGHNHMYLRVIPHNWREIRMLCKEQSEFWPWFVTPSNILTRRPLYFCINLLFAHTWSIAVRSGTPTLQYRLYLSSVHPPEIDMASQAVVNRRLREYDWNPKIKRSPTDLHAICYISMMNKYGSSRDKCKRWTCSISKWLASGIDSYISIDFLFIRICDSLMEEKYNSLLNIAVQLYQFLFHINAKRSRRMLVEDSMLQR